MTRTMAISIFKGGTGKTTTAVNLSAALSRQGKRVLLINTDTQPQCGQSLGINPPLGLPQFIEGDREAIFPARDNLDFLAGGAPLAAVKMEIARQPFGGEKTLSNALEPVNGDYDYIIIDTGPGFDSLSIAALFAAHEVLSPVNLESLAVHGLVDFMTQLSRIEQHHDIELRYIVPNALDRRTSQTGEILDQLETHFTDKVCNPIRYNVRLSEAAGHGQHIFEYAPRSRGAEDFSVLAQRILDDE